MFLDSSLERATLQACSVFGNPCLVPAQGAGMAAKDACVYTEIVRVELYTF